MRNLSNTIERMTALRNRQPGDQRPANDRLARLDDFGTNPGALAGFHFVPARACGPMPLVVVLHGCTQSAAGYDHGSGWTQLAEELGFAVLYPEQTRANNFNLCFNWYERTDSGRGAGEPESIRQMIAAMADRHAIDPTRVFVTGLSAGGAMTSVMLATHPELFAGGAIIAGLPFGSATTLPEAFDRMRGHGGPVGPALTALVEAASDHPGPWPTISVWHGSADAIVDSANAETIIAQWRPIHGVSTGPSETDVVDGYPHRVWRDASGRAVIEDYSVTGMGHGTPLSTMGDEACGNSGAHMLETGISSTRHIARFWGLAEGQTGTATVARTVPTPTSRLSAPRNVLPPATNDVGKVIEDALRAAGLMR